MVRDRHTSRTARRSLSAFGLTAILGLGACAKADGMAQPFDSPQLSSPTVAEEAASTIERTEFRVEAGQESIALTQWRPGADAKAVILAVHGYGDYGSSTFARAAEDWAQQGILTYAYDQRGFGRNPSNGDWPGHEALIDDLGKISALIRNKHPDKPLILIGHSMGGGVVTAALGEGRVQVDRAVLLAPALWGGANLSPFLRAMAHAAHTVAPNKRWTGDGIVKIQASDNIEMLRGLGRDPLYVRNPSSREFVGLIRLMDRAVAAAPTVETPILVVYGAKDEVVPEAPITDAFDAFKGPKRYEKIETGWHMLLRDLEGSVVRDLVAEFALDEDGAS